MAIETSQFFSILLKYMAATKLNRAMDLQILKPKWQSLKIFKVVHCITRNGENFKSKVYQAVATKTYLTVSVKEHWN